MLRKTMFVLAIAVALGGSSLPTNAFATSSTEGDHMVSGAKAAHRSDHNYERQARGRRGQEWDPWHHWGAYYGPNPAPL